MNTHESVLLQEVKTGLTLKPNYIVVDATINGGGHSEMIVQELDDNGVLLGIDMDSKALNLTRERLAKATCKVILKEGNNRNLDTFLQEENIKHVDRFLYDLGLSSHQLDNGLRGFSFRHDEPLFMTFKQDPQTEDLTAYEVVNSWDESSIADVLYGYGDESFSRQIAKSIVDKRKKETIDTSFKLVDAIKAGVPDWYTKKQKHFATKTFQALRITVNDEMESVKESLENARRYLAMNGRIVVITFHSTEDRIVKHMFKGWQKEGYGKVLTKKPTLPTREEIRNNPRSRSAKLRIFENQTQ